MRMSQHEQTSEAGRTFDPGVDRTHPDDHRVSLPDAAHHLRYLDDRLGAV